MTLDPVVVSSLCCQSQSQRLLQASPDYLNTRTSSVTSSQQPHSRMGLDILLLQDDRGGNIESVRASQRLRFASVELVDEVLALHKASIAGE